MKNPINTNISVSRKVKTLILLFTIYTTLFSLYSCEKELEVQTNFPFELVVMPIPKNITKDQTIEIRCTIKGGGGYLGTKYFLRYFQYDGSGKLNLSTAAKFSLVPNDRYALGQRQFNLYYTGGSNERQTFVVWVSDNQGNEQEASFEFN